MWQLGQLDGGDDFTCIFSCQDSCSIIKVEPTVLSHLGLGPCFIQMLGTDFQVLGFGVSFFSICLNISLIDM